jgi:recombination protein RecA
MAEDGKHKALETTVAQIKRRYGEGAIMKLGDSSSLNVEAIPTGCIALDLALGIGGIPRGRITEIFGPEASGRPNYAARLANVNTRRAVARLWMWSTLSTPLMRPSAA